MDSLKRFLQPASTAATSMQMASTAVTLVPSTVFIKRVGKQFKGTFCLKGDTLEAIVQCLVFLKAFSVRMEFFQKNF